MRKYSERMLSPKTKNKPHARYRIRAVERALLLLKVFLGNEAELGAMEIGKRIGLDPSTTFRMLVTLEENNFVKQDAATGKYRLGASCLELGSQFLRHNDVRRSAIEAMIKLRDQFGETVHLGILDGDEIVYLEKVPGLYAIGLLSSRVGGRAPAYATAIGKVLLAFSGDETANTWRRKGKLAHWTPNTLTDEKDLAKALNHIRQNGYAIDNEEFELSVRCVAAPVFSHKGVTAALSISGPTERMDDRIKKHHLVQAVKQAAAEISAEMGWGRGVDQIGKPPASNPQRKKKMPARST